MMKKINNWWNKPWTNGTYVKYCVGAFITSMAVYCAWYAWFMHKLRKEEVEENEPIEF